jgi:hypothetical protein
MELGSMDFPITAACRIDYGNNFLWFSILQTEQFFHIKILYQITMRYYHSKIPMKLFRTKEALNRISNSWYSWTVHHHHAMHFIRSSNRSLNL